MKKVLITIFIMFLTTQFVFAVDNIRYKTKSNGDTYVYKNGVLAKRYHKTSGGRTVVYNSEGRVIRSYSRSSSGGVRVYNENGEQVARLRGQSSDNNYKSYGYRSPYQNNRRGSLGGDPRSISNNRSISNIRSVSNITPVQPMRAPVCTTTFVRYR